MKKITAVVLLSTLTFLSGTTAFAGSGPGRPPVLQVLDGSLGQVAKDSFNIVSDTMFFDASYNSVLVSKSYPVRNKVVLRINPYTPYTLQKNFFATVRLEVTVTNVSGTTSSFDTSLTVRYNKDSLVRDGDAYLFSNAYRVKVKVIDRSTDASWDVWKSLLIENELQPYPVFDFQCDRDTILSVTHGTLDSTTTNDELPVSWANVAGADQYDLEWTYIDSSALLAGIYGAPSNPTAKLIFENSCSRVTITGTSYNIPIFYDGTGTLFFRVRPVNLQAGGGRTEGHWTSDKQAPGSWYFKGHERRLNWQSTASYAEEGKRKVVLQYYDGSLRSRQTVTKDNTTNTTLISESMYDYQGRPVIQVLPAPTFDNVIKYTENFNRGLNGSYDKSEFDTFGGTAFCDTHAPQMDSLTKGASYYYSSKNPDKDSSFGKNIPNAGGYPFTELAYVQDNTGRISKQSGVGPNHQLGSGHETSYFYGSPDQHELDALFGTEVGDHSHYFKTMVKDANGQFSISYTDMHGRTIATALAGTPDSNRIDKLPSYTPRKITEKLTDPTSNVVHDLVMESKKGLLVAVPGVHEFTYKLDPASLQLQDCNNTTVCYDCLYDLEITITDDCNNSKISPETGQPFVTVVHNFSLTSHPDTTCSQNANSFSYTFSKSLPVGSYEITKRLSISRYGESYYRDSVYTPRNACKTVTTFAQEARAIQATISECVPSCESCLANLGNYSTFYNSYLANAGLPAEDSTYKGEILAAYQQAQDDCKALCQTNNEADDIRAAMLLDMTPPSGQYANVDSAAKMYSIFHIDYGADGNPTSTPKYIDATKTYLDEFGRPDSVYDEASGIFVKPQALSPEAFSEKFKMSWAEALLPFHPEYPKLQAYLNYPMSAAWDRRFESTDFYDSAVAKGYLNPTGGTGSPYSKYGTPVDPDPLATYYTGFKSAIETKLTVYVNDGLPTSHDYNLWQYATAMVRCASRTASCVQAYNNNDSAFSSNFCQGDLDMVWRNFRQMYLDLKRKILNDNLQTAPGAVPTYLLTNNYYSPHFTDALELIDAGRFDTTSDKSINDAKVQAYYESTCRAYVTQWLKDLQNCNYTDADTAILIPRLIQVCKEGSDYSHPNGASSVAPSSNYSYKSFEDVIEQYNASTNRTSTSCNVYSISAPKPYNQQTVYSNKPIWTGPDSCECGRINSIYNNYQSVHSKYLSFSDYIYKNYQTSIADSVLTQLRNSCSVVASTTACQYLAKPIQLPPLFQCGAGDICVGSTQFSALDAEFRSKYPGLIPVTNSSPTDSTQLSINKLYEDFMNYRLGFSKSAADYLDFLGQVKGGTAGGSGTTIYDTATISCVGLDSLIKEYKSSYLSPFTGYADLDMRTFAGNITPSNGPKGVFNVHGAFIGNTVNGSVFTIDTSFASIWNSDTANKAVGALSALENGKFRLTLKPNQLVPQQGIIGQRFYQFDLVVDTLDAVVTNLGSYIDFGDGKHIKVDSIYSSDSTTIGIQYAKLSSDLTGYYWVWHKYASTQARTVTVYHTDFNGIVGFDNYLNLTHAYYLPGYKNLRGYAPKILKMLHYHSTQDSTLNTLDGFENKNELSGLVWIDLLSGDNVTPFKNYHFGNMLQFKNSLQFFAMQNGTTEVLNADTVLPNMPVNFPQIKQVLIQKSIFSPNMNFTLPHMSGVQVPFLTTPDIDRIVRQLASATTADTGRVRLQLGEHHSPLADSAVAALVARHWTIEMEGDSANIDLWRQKNDTTFFIRPYPVSSQFADFINGKFGTSMDWSTVNDMYKRKCGALPDLTTPDTVSTPLVLPDSCSNAQFINDYITGPNNLDIVQTADGGYVTVGSENVFRPSQHVGGIMKVDKSGNIKWHHSYSNTYEFTRIRKTNDGGYIVVGSSKTYAANGEPLLMKFDSSGNVTWMRTYGVGSSNGEWGVDVTQTSDGGYALAANYNNDAGVSDFEVIRVDGSGNTTWAERLGTSNSEMIGGILEDQDTLVISGLSISTTLGNPSSYYDGVIAKINRSNGNVIWANSYDIDTLSNWFRDIHLTPNGYLVNSVMTEGYGGSGSALGDESQMILELDKNGVERRARMIATPAGDKAGIIGVYPTADGGYVSTQSEDTTKASIYISKSDSSGHIEWANRVRFQTAQQATRVITNGDGSYAVTGGYSESFILRTDALGTTGCYDSAITVTSNNAGVHRYTSALSRNTITASGTSRTAALTTSRPEGWSKLCSHITCAPIIRDTLFLCGRAEPVFNELPTNTVTNCSDSTFFITSKSIEYYAVYRDSLLGNFEASYRAKCLEAYKYESFTVKHDVSEYHHTLYYYDQAGNLLKTVPPAGVQENYDSVWLDNVAAARDADMQLVPAHGLNTQYRYNTLNQVIAQQTPDAGQSRFWYDRLGRLAISQNARQKYVSGSEAGRQYSYTLYDYIGRITEVGQLANAGSAAMSDSISRNETNLLSWVTASAANKEQITQTVYDTAYAGFTGLSFYPVVQRNLKNRVAYTSFTLGSNPLQYNQGTFYTYDIEGNVDTLLQDYGSSSITGAQNVMNLNGNRWKKVVYQYDLVSGKVNSVAYQPHQVDAFYHRYSYDAENRLILSETSQDSVFWDRDARYEYYKHGPLARAVIGDKMVQGLDYAYTLQGWLKGVNSMSLSPLYDMGRDGDTSTQNRYVARDVYGFGLNYYAGDYTPIGTQAAFPGTSGPLDTANYRPLYNGNISSMAVNLGPLYRSLGSVTDNSHWRGPLLYNYKYDQLNRITKMDAFYGLNQATNSWAGLTSTTDLKERVSYDGNGNIQRYTRNNFGETGRAMDSLEYKYLTGTNKLSRIIDSASDAIGGGYDIHNQPGNNYKYDSIGNLVRDSSERLSIQWNVYGKITQIDHDTTTAARPTRRINYYYDAAGNRIGKRVTRGDTATVAYTWYVRDASGNVMATYNTSLDSSQALGNADMKIGEKHLYGSSRLGILSAGYSTDANTNGLSIYTSPWAGKELPYYSGAKQYELSNHLGNVLATISDKKIGVSLAADSSLIDHYEADVQTAQDYYPFGMVMPGRMFAKLTIPGGSVSGQGQVNGYTLPVDLTLNSRSGTDPISYVATDYIDLTDGFTSNTNDDVTAYIADASYAGGGNGEGSSVAGSGKYRYGFNGKENDNDVKGFANQIDYGMRVYDPRIARFSSVDPLTKKYAGLTPYQFASNTPIWALDLDGKEAWLYYDNLFGWKQSRLFGGPVTEADANKFGYYSAAQVHKFQEVVDIENNKQERFRREEETIANGNHLISVMTLPGLAYEMSPVKGLYDASVTSQEGHPVIGAAMAGLALTDLGQLFKATGSGYGVLAKGLAAKYSLAKTWEFHPLIRGILVEARMASHYASKGFEWLAESASPFFRKIDFYNESTKAAISLKSVNAKENFDFKNIMANIDELVELRKAGATAQFGRELKINSVELHIATPEGYDRSILKEVEQYAQKKKIDVRYVAPTEK